MFDLYTVTQAERVDQLAVRLFGRTAGYVESIFAANRGLAAEVPPDAELEVGRVLRIPRDNDGDQVEVVRLWS